MAELRRTGRTTEVSADYLGFDEELDAVRRARLRLVATVGAVLLLVFSGFMFTGQLLGGVVPRTVPAHMPVAVASFATLTFVAVALLCRLPSLRTQTIMKLDFFLFAVNIAVGSLSSIAITENGDHFASYEGILLGLVLHGVFVPTRTRFAVALGLVAVGSFLLAQMSAYLYIAPVRALWDATPGTHAFPVLLGYKTLVVLFFAAIGVLASRIFYGLARDAYKAKRLGNYTIERELASGGMGQVFVARHRMLRRPTAVKVIRPERLGAGGLEELTRFEREVDLASKLTHPNTVSIYDFGRATDGTFYFAMELLAGWNLHELVERHGPLPAARAVHLLKQICGSLSEAHELGIVHRDIKPSNVILTRRGGLCDFVKVIDFGLAKQLRPGGRHDELTQTGKVYGTPLYLAPECIYGSDKPDARADLYAVGAVGYWLLTGRHVFEGNAMKVLIDHAKTAPVPPSQVSELEIPRELETIVMRCLDKSPAARFGSADELLDALEALGLPAWTNRQALAWWEIHRPGGSQVDAPAADEADAAGARLHLA